MRINLYRQLGRVWYHKINIRTALAVFSIFHHALLLMSDLLLLSDDEPEDLATDIKENETVLYQIEKKRENSLRKQRVAKRHEQDENVAARSHFEVSYSEWRKDRLGKFRIDRMRSGGMRCLTYGPGQIEAEYHYNRRIDICQGQWFPAESPSWSVFIYDYLHRSLLSLHIS